MMNYCWEKSMQFSILEDMAISSAYDTVIHEFFGFFLGGRAL